MYNFLTGALIELDEDTRERIRDVSLLSDSEINILKTNGFLIDDFDEVSYLRFGNKLVCSDDELLSILITPTMECDFNCPYCFEHHG
jgi:uncharacterized protein